MYIVAWFTWDARCGVGGVGGEGGLVIGSEGLSARAAGWQPRVALADQPLARGLHYWRLRIDHYDGDADPAFGVARADVARDKMLGMLYTDIKTVLQMFYISGCC